MSQFLSVLRFAHILPVVFMAAPFYMLILVNERGQFGPAIDYKLDRYFENIIKRQPKRCYIFLLTILASGLAILIWGVMGIGSLMYNWILMSKLIFFLTLAALLTYVHFGIQPRSRPSLSR